MGRFLIRSGCRRELISSYLDEKRVSCRDFESAGCGRYGEGEQVWVDEHKEWAGERAVVEEKFNKLQNRCAIYWVVGQEFSTKEEEQ